MGSTFEPAFVTRLLGGVGVHGAGGSELFLVLYAIRGVALAAAALASLTARTRTPGQMAAARV